MDEPFRKETDGKDVFIHVMMLKRCGVKNAAADDKISFDSGDLIKKEKGWELEKILSHTSVTPVQPRTAPRTLPISAKVKNYDDTKGYGFLQPFNGDPELFFHDSILVGREKPKVGDEFLITAFVRGATGKRDVATAIRPLFA